MGEQNWSQQILEAHLQRIEGIENVKVFFDERDEVAEIHVLAGPNRQPKQIVRDIETIFVTQFGMNVDHRKISVVQLKSGHDVVEERLQILGIRASTSKNFITLEVELGLRDQVFLGSQEGAASDANRLRIASAATLDAVSKALSDNIVFVVEDVTKCAIADQQAIVVGVSCLGKLHGELFLGCALIHSDELEATVRATMDAVNRRLGLISSLY